MIRIINTSYMSLWRYLAENKFGRGYQEENQSSAQLIKTTKKEFSISVVVKQLEQSEYRAKKNVKTCITSKH